ncbi:MAG: hypothetical protein ACI4S2_10385 [Lachnospiraceae bacterium]
MLQRIFGGSKFLKKMNTLMELYSVSHNADATYKELLKLEPLIRTQGELSWYNLNRAALLYDMKRFAAAADIIMEIDSLNPEFDAKCAQLKTKIMNAL